MVTERMSVRKPSSNVLRVTESITERRGNSEEKLSPFFKHPVIKVREAESISEQISDRESCQFFSKHTGWIERKIGKNQPASFPKLFAGTTTYYFTNFPDSYGVEDTRKVFHKWGRVRDVFIPLKKDKFGKRFGFFKFQDVHAPKALEAKLDGIWLGSHRLMANIFV